MKYREICFGATKRHITSAAVKLNLNGFPCKKINMLLNENLSRDFTEKRVLIFFVFFSQDAYVCVENSIRLAREYLTKEVTNIPVGDVFQLAITSYALVDGGRINRDAFDKLWPLRRTRTYYFLNISRCTLFVYLGV